MRTRALLATALLALAAGLAHGGGTIALPLAGSLPGLTNSNINGEAFFAVIGGGNCPTGTCGSIDFDGDGDEGTDSDIEAFFRVVGGGPCTP